MEFKEFSPENMETLEQYGVTCILGLISLKSLFTYQQRAIDLGILKEDEECRLNTMAWDISRLMRLYQQQAESILERLPGTLNLDEALKELTKQTKKKRNAKKKSTPS